MKFLERMAVLGCFRRARLFSVGLFLLTIVGLASVLAIPRGVPAARNESRGNEALAVKEIDGLGSAWDRLAPYQRQVLLPLRDVWHTLDVAQQEQWQLLADSFRDKSATEQRRLSARIREWARLTPGRRAQARLGFLQAATQYGNKRRIERWAAYQKLPPDQRHQASSAGKLRSVSPASVHPAVGATTMLMPQVFPLQNLGQVAQVGTDSIEHQ